MNIQQPILMYSGYKTSRFDHKQVVFMYAQNWIGWILLLLFQQHVFIFSKKKENKKLPFIIAIYWFWTDVCPESSDRWPDSIFFFFFYHCDPKSTQHQIDTISLY